jgi:inhibitor of Bruton tyrosine kinase
MGRCRKRSVSGGSLKDMSNASSTGGCGAYAESLATNSTAFGESSLSSTSRVGGGGSCSCSIQLVAAQDLLEAILRLENAATGRYFLHDCCFENNNNTKRRQQQQDEKAVEEQHHDYYTPEAERNSLLSLAAGLLTRAEQVDSSSAAAAPYNNTKTSGNHSSSKSSNANFLRRFLLQRDAESGYTPLHSAVQRGDLALILLFLRTALSSSSSLHYYNSHHDHDQHHEPRITHRPMLLLHQVGLPSHKAAAVTATAPRAPIISTKGSSPLSLLHAMVTAVDDEGFTAADLLAALQQKRLLQCRLSLPRAKIIPFTTSTTANDDTTASGSSGRRRSSFDLAENDNNDDEQNQNEFDLLSRHLPVLPRQVADSNNDVNRNRARNNPEVVAATTTTTTTTTLFGCEVITFGLDHHCALGVGATTTSSSSTTTTTTTKTSSSSVAAAPNTLVAAAVNLIRPQRVQALAPRPGQKQGAVAVAAAAHHTLVVMGRCDGGSDSAAGAAATGGGGHLYAFGLGRGGRLGTGHETPCPTPTRIRGALQGRVVVGVAAAENHSLCVTQCGNVYAWGSNRFGQVGIAAMTATGAGGSGVSASSMRLVPRRVDDLKQVHCVAVAAGEKHSVALSNQGHGKKALA